MILVKTGVPGKKNRTHPEGRTGAAEVIQNGGVLEFNPSQGERKPLTTGNESEEEYDEVEVRQRHQVHPRSCASADYEPIEPAQTSGNPSLPEGAEDLCPPSKKSTNDGDARDGDARYEVNAVPSSSSAKVRHQKEATAKSVNWEVDGTTMEDAIAEQTRGRRENDLNIKTAKHSRKAWDEEDGDAWTVRSLCIN